MPLNNIQNNLFPQYPYISNIQQPHYTMREYNNACDSFFTNEFSKSDTETAKNTGIILTLGFMFRGLLQKFSNNLFSSYFSKQQNINEKQVTDISLKILKDKGLMQNIQKIEYPNATIYTDNLKKLNLFVEKTGQNAHFDYINKAIKVSKNTLLSLPHEIGHAVQENNTTILKKLQRFRGNYSFLALLLYGLGRNKSTDPKEKKSIFGKAQDILHKYNLLIPLIAFSPELITEFAASKIGTNSLKKANAPKSLINSARKHYAIAFCTYLALPLFAVLDNLILKKASKN